MHFYLVTLESYCLLHLPSGTLSLSPVLSSTIQSLLYSIHKPAFVSCLSTFVRLISSTRHTFSPFLIFIGIVGALLIRRCHCHTPSNEEEDVTPTRILGNPQWIGRQRRQRGVGRERAQIEESKFWWRKRRKLKDPPPNILLSLQANPPPPPPPSPPSFPSPAPPLATQQQHFSPLESELGVMSPSVPTNSLQEKGNYSIKLFISIFK